MVKIPTLPRGRRAKPAPPPPQVRDAPWAVPRERVAEVEGKRSFSTAPRLGSVDSLDVAPLWIKDTRTIPEELVADAFAARALSRRLWTNIPMVRSWADAVMENTLEPRFPMLEWDDRAPESLVGQFRDVVNEFLESRVADGGLSGAEFCKNLLRHSMIDGDIFWTTSVVRDKLYFRPIEADLIDSSRLNTSMFESIYSYIDRGRSPKSNPIVGGIGFSKETGQPLRYYFSRPIKADLPASQIVHVRRHMITGWPRGLPWGRASFNSLVRLESFAGAEMERQINSARLYFFTTTENPNSYASPGSFDGTSGSNTLPPPPPPPTADSIASPDNPALRLMRNSILQLDPGTKLETLNELGNKISPIPFIEILQTDAASGLGLSLPLLLRDYNKTNFSSGRLASESDKLYFQATRDWISNEIFYPILRKLFEHAMATGRITARNGLLPAEARLLLRPSVRWPSWPTTEPHREIPALVVAHREGAISLQDMISRILPHARVEDVFAKIAAERVLAKQYGVEDIVGATAEILLAEADRQAKISEAEDAASRTPETPSQGKKAQNPPLPGA